MSRILLVAAIVAVAVAAAGMSLTRQRQDAPAATVAQQSPQPLDAEAARSLLASGALLADVREPEELAETGKLAGAINVPLTRIKALAAQGATPAELQSAKTRPVILYCRSGRRSNEAGEILLRHGFSRVYNLGGFEDAVRAGLPAG